MKELSLLVLAAAAMTVMVRASHASPAAPSQVGVYQAACAGSYTVRCVIIDTRTGATVREINP